MKVATPINITFCDELDRKISVGTGTAAAIRKRSIVAFKECLLATGHTLEDAIEIRVNTNSRNPYQASSGHVRIHWNSGLEWIMWKGGRAVKNYFPNRYMKYNHVQE